ncbi:hypothetical protein DH86_00004202, partial [Scytalidium sp. 3C]
LFKVVLEDFGFEAPGDIEALSAQAQIDAFYSVFTLVFGLPLLLFSTSMVDGNKTWRNYIGIASNILLGIGTCLLSTMLLTSASDNLGESPWSLPLLVFVLVIALILNHIPLAARAKGKKFQP